MNRNPCATQITPLYDSIFCPMLRNLEKINPLDPLCALPKMPAFCAACPEKMRPLLGLLAGTPRALRDKWLEEFLFLLGSFLAP